MSFLDKNIIECVSAKITDLGRKRISEGNFNITYFKVGDSEYDYKFADLDNYILHPTELDCDLKYPILMDTTTNLDYATVVANHSVVTVTENVTCDPNIPWKMNIVWSEKPAGLDNTFENLSGYGSNSYTSAKEYFGYTSLSGQTSNTGTTYFNSIGGEIVLSPKDQKTIALIHYSGEHFDIYDDWFAYDAEAREFFQLTITNLSYHRSSGTTIGYTFKMSDEGGYVESSKNNSPCLGERYFYLIDNGGHNVGKIFINKRVIVIDDEEICAALSDNSQRTWTYPAPKLNYIVPDLPCSPDSGSTTLLSGTTKDVWVTYVFNNNTMHCNYYSKLEGVDGEANVSVKFGNEFRFLGLDYNATELGLLVQVVNHGERPSSDAWMYCDITNQLPGHNTGNNITQAMLDGHQFILTKAMYEDGTLYELSNYIGIQPFQNGGQNDPQFGDETLLPGIVYVTRATNIYEMNFVVNLPATQFMSSQNPTKLVNVVPRVTEIGLYNDKKELMVIGKASSPHERLGFQQFAVKIDF
jgi:hypothetical protein